MNRLILAAATAALIGTMPGLLAADEVVINDEMPRRPAGSLSGSLNSVEANCPIDPSGNDWQDATANLKIEQVGDSSAVQIRVKGAVPNTHFTVWLRIKGGSGFNDAGSPWTGGGDTPLCSGTEFADLNAISPWNNPAGDTEPHCNSFYTAGNGNGQFKATVNFPVVGGAYPFQQSGGDPSRPGAETIPDVPTAIVDPRTGNGGPYLLRVMSHCTDQATHGLSPNVREAWFQFP
jgi:hypothetical protein